MNEKRMVIGIDLDECLYGFLDATLDAFYGAGHVTTSQVREVKADPGWNFWEAWGHDSNWFWSRFADLVKEGKIYWSGHVIGEPVEALMWAASVGDIHLVTAREIPGCLNAAKQATHYWLLNELGPIPWSSVTISDDKRCINADIFFDDSTLNLQALHDAGTHAVAIDRPWNQDWEGDRIPNLEYIEDYMEHISTKPDTPYVSPAG